MRLPATAVALVTGGGSGIGRSISRYLGRGGATVVVADLDVSAAEATVGAIVESGGRAHAHRVDVSDPPSVAAMVDAVVHRHGRLDYLFNNAGISVTGEFQDISVDLWQRVVDVDFWGVVHGCRAAYPVMVDQGSGHIVNTASLAGLIPGGLSTPYSASKHAVVGFSVSLRGEARQYGVKVSALCPGYLQTGIQRTTPSVSPYLSSPALRRRAASITTQTPDDCIDQMMRGVARNRAIVVAPTRQRPLWWVNRAAPEALPYAWDGAIRVMKRRADTGWPAGSERRRPTRDEPGP